MDESFALALPPRLTHLTVWVTTRTSHTFTARGLMRTFMARGPMRTVSPAPRVCLALLPSTLRSLTLNNVKIAQDHPLPDSLHAIMLGPEYFNLTMECGSGPLRKVRVRLTRTPPDSRLW